MKILIANDGIHAHYFERKAWVNALNSVDGVQAVMYDVKSAPAFHVFDSFEPNIYIGQLYNLDKATIKCIQKRPHLKVILRAGEWNDEEPNPHILRVTEDEINILNQIDVDVIHSHYIQKDIEITHKKFIDNNINVVGLPMSADVHTYYYANKDDRLTCDIAFVGGYWPYKGEIIDSYLTPLCEDYSYNIKIFGNQIWPHVNQYCGILNDQQVANLFNTAKICPNLSEPHAHTYGRDVNERAFKVLAASGFCIMDSIQAMKELVPDGIVYAENPIDFKNKVNYFLQPENQAEKNEITYIGHKAIINSHTNYDRMISLMKSVKETQLCKELEKEKNDFFYRI